MEAAALVGDSWVFTRLSEELTRSRWSGQPPWDALHTLADELGLPELEDFADIMRLSGEEGPASTATCVPDPPPCERRCSTTKSPRPMPSASG